MSALADRHLGEAFVRLRLRLGQLPPEYLRLPALIHEGLTQQMPDYAAACILSSKNPWFCQSEFLGIATGIPW